MPPTILYLDTIPGDPIHALTLAGIRRYAATLGWVATAVPESETRPEALGTLFRDHAPVAGCIVECAGLHAGFPPRLFGKTPVVYLHAPPALHGGAGARIRWDGVAIARTAFRELSAGRPPSFTVAGTRGRFNWSLERSRAFAAIAAKTGAKCLVFETRAETEEERFERLVRWVAGWTRGSWSMEGSYFYEIVDDFDVKGRPANGVFDGKFLGASGHAIALSATHRF